MSTRANIIVKDKYSKLWFYRHSDGYPEETMPTLNKFLDLIKSGKIRSNPMQSAGWLIVIGREDYHGNTPVDKATDWKVGAYEPTDRQHGDIEYLYTVDLDKMTIDIKEV